MRITGNPVVAQRLREFGKKQFGTMAAFGRALRLRPQELYVYLKGESKPGNTLQAKLRELGCDIEWLMTGKRSAANFPDEIGRRRRSEYRVEATIPAGLAHLTDRSDWPESESIDYPPEEYIWLEVSKQMGESMIPLIRPTDLLLITDREKPKPGDIVAARWRDDEGAIKIYSESDEKVVLSSYNPLIPPVVLPKSKVKLYRVVLIKKR